MSRTGPNESHGDAAVLITHTRVALYVAALACALALALFLPLLTTALLTESFWRGVGTVRRNWWALTSFVDYCGGALFAQTYLWVREGMTARTAAWSLAQLLVGNPVTLVYALSKMARAAWRGGDDASLAPALLAKDGDAGSDLTTLSSSSSSSSSTAIPSNRQTAARALLAAANTAFFVAYVVALGAAFRTQSLGDGWAYIQRHIWCRVTLYDLLCGVLFTALYIACRETYHGASPMTIALWMIALVFLGNGVTAAYVVSRLLPYNELPVVSSTSPSWSSARRQQQRRPALDTAMFPHEHASLR